MSCFKQFLPAGLHYPRIPRLVGAVLLAGSLVIPAFAQNFFGNDDTPLLAEEEAFRFTAWKTDQGNIHTVWEIADGYYLYRDKTGFELDGKAVAIASLLPGGEVKDDPLFGQVEVYTGQLAVILATAHPTAVSITAFAQGCNEPVGVCYPPMRREIALSDQTGSPEPTPGSPPADNAEDALSRNDANTPDTIDELRALMAEGLPESEFLPVDEAFQVSIHPGQSAGAFSVQFAIAPGYYLYRDRLGFTLSGDQAATLTPDELPEGRLKDDPYFGKVAIFEEDFSAPLTMSRTSLANVMQVTYQGCAHGGICYPPETRTFAMGGLVAAAQAASDDNDATPSQSANQASPGDTRSIWGLLGGALLAGLLLTFTPCVLPMVPILSSIIAGQGDQSTRLRGGLLASAYVLGTVLAYAGMGALAGATGDQLQAYFQNIWAIGALSLLFFIMALAMLGVFTLQLPASIQTAVQNRTQSLSGSIPLVFVFGIASALVVGACVSPILISFLGLAISSQDPMLGAILMASMALGMGMPLILFGVGMGHLLPRAGAWMERIKQGFGVMLIGVSIYLLGLLPNVPVLLLWGGFFVVLSIFLGALTTLHDNASNGAKLIKGCGVLLLVWGVSAFVGGLLGQRDVFRPLPTSLLTVASAPSKDDPQGLVFEEVTNMPELESALADARVGGKFVLIDYYADWCVECVKMEQTTFADRRIVNILNEKFVSLQVDVTDPNDDDRRELKRKFGVFGPPATLFLDTQGNLLADKNFYGYMNADDFLQLIENIQSKS